MRVLTNRATREDVERFWKEVDPLTDSYQAKDIEAVLDVSFQANVDIFTMYEEEDHKNMSQALWDYISDTDYVKNKLSAIREECISAGNLENARVMLKDGVSIQNAAKWSGVPFDRVKQLAASL